MWVNTTLDLLSKNFSLIGIFQLILGLLFYWNLKANIHTHLKPALPHPGSLDEHIPPPIGLAVGPEPAGRLYKTPPVLKARVRQQEGLWDLQRANRNTDYTQTYCSRERWKMCKGLAALPQTCLERWELQTYSTLLSFPHCVVMLSSDYMHPWCGSLDILRRSLFHILLRTDQRSSSSGQEFPSEETLRFHV